MLDFVYDDGGREAAGFDEQPNDCFARAYAIMFDVGYQEALDAVYKVMGDGYKYTAYKGVPKKKIEIILTNAGLIRAGLEPRRKPTLTAAYERFGQCIAVVTHHIVCLKDGALRDTFDCRMFMRTDFSGKQHEAERIALEVYRKPVVI